MKTFKITSYHEVYIDSFKEGELNHVNHYSLNANIQSETLREAIESYFENELYYSFNFEESEIDEDKKFIQWNVLVDNENSEVNDTDSVFAQWKKGKKTLYVNNISVCAELVTELSF